MTKILSADRLARFNRIFKQAVDLFEDEAEAIQWLNTPKSALDGETPRWNRLENPCLAV